MTQGMKWKVGNETIEIWQYGLDDYSAYFVQADCSVRGSLLQVMQEINETFGIESVTE